MIKKTGYYLSALEINGKRKRLHIYVWEDVHGEIPRGYHIHHVDSDKSNNEPSNLICIPRHNHLSYHSKKNAMEDRSKLDYSLKLARKEAVNWHRSEDGREWHKKQYQATKDKLYIKKKFICAYCGKEFESSKSGSKFCCNAHKTAYRANSGIDNETRTCCICGAKFEINRYSKTKTCSRHCAMKLQWENRAR